MSRDFATDEILLKAIELRNETFSPAAGAGVAGAVGSFWVRNGNYPTTPTETYLKLATINTGWVKQNTVNLNIFNVKRFGATGDGATDDTAAIQAAINAAVAAGGGCIYFPATPNAYRVVKIGLQSFLLANVHDLTFLGDGFASTISMIANAALGEWHMFTVSNASKRIRFVNLAFLGSGITNPDPANQAHFIQVSGFGTDTAGASDIDVVGCWFGQIKGAAVRNLAESTKEVSNIRVMYNAFDMVACRSNVEAQRYSRRVQVHFNWCTGTASGNLIDFEPTGGSGLGTAGPEEWSMIGNLMDNGSQGSDTITIGGTGSADPGFRNLCAYNIITHGGGIQGGDVSRLMLIGNIIVEDSTSIQGMIDFQRVTDYTVVYGNLIIALNNTGSKSAVRFFDSAAIDPERVAVHDNFASCMNSNALGMAAFDFESVTEGLADGNIIVVDTTVNIVCFGILFRAQAQDVDNCIAVGNLIIGTTNQLAQGVDFAASPSNMKNTAANHNLVNNAFSGIRWERAAAQTFTGWRCADGNNLVNMTNQAVDYPATNVGVSVAGTAGPGDQIVGVNTGAGPAGLVAAPAGSLCVNLLGAATTALFYKESGAGVSGGTAGWIHAGDSELVFAAQSVGAATTALFFATGMGLATATAVEIKFPVTRACAIRNLRITCVAGVGGGNNTYTVRKNGVNQSLTATIANTAITGSDLSHVVQFAAGDLLSVQITKSVAPGTPQTFVVITLGVEG